jgi:hypothetical protein
VLIDAIELSSFEMSALVFNTTFADRSVEAAR